MALTLHGTVSDNTVALDRKTATPLIINGDMQIAQRGTSVTGVTSTGYRTVDRMLLSINTLGTWTVAQTASAPDNTGLTNSYRVDCTTADASPAAADFIIFSTRLEGQNMQIFKKGTANAEKMTISFYVKSNKTGTYIMELDDNDNARNINKAYTISSANTWEKKVLTFDGDTTGAFGNDNGSSLQLLWWLGSGSNFSSGSLQTAWAGTDNTKRAVGNVNLADSTDNDWSITGLQLEVGDFDANSIPAFQFEDIRTSLGRCQRYFQKSFPQGTDPQEYGSYVGGQSDAGVGAVMSSTEYKVVINFKCEMRSAPTMRFYKAQNTPDDGEWTYWDGGDNLNPSSMGSNAQTHRFTAVLGFSGGGKNTGRAGLTQGNYTADAEL